MSKLTSNLESLKSKSTKGSTAHDSMTFGFEVMIKSMCG